MSNRFLVFQVLMWFQMIILVPMAVIGTVYFAAVLANLTELSSLVFPIADFLANLLQVLFYGFIGYAIALAVFRRITRSKAPLEQPLLERVGSIVAQTKARMGFPNQSRPFVLRGSANAFYRGRGRIVVGEKLARNMNDRELAGIVGHEIGHALKHHVLFKTIMTPALLFSIIVALLITNSFKGGGILLWTVASLFTLIQIPLSWRLEYSADAKAAEVLGGDTMTEALQKLGSMNFSGISFTHPPLSSRIRKVSAYGPMLFTFVPATAPVPPPPATTPVTTSPINPPITETPLTASVTTNTWQTQEKQSTDNRQPAPDNARGLAPIGDVLSSGVQETILWRGRRAYHLRYPILALVFFVGIFLIDLGPIGETIGTLSTLFWIVFTIVSIISLILDRRRTFYITNQRIVAGDAVMLSQDLVKVDAPESFFGRLRGVGKVHFFFRDGRWIAFNRVKDPALVKQVAIHLMDTRDRLVSR